ncbi:LptF/LptG family permease [Blattabacterium punctulatus]|uniref:LptF/LptG family permease n=1 Tax=Blattabacterium punctulatus TaxID=164514 RepID=UPI000D7C9AC3|nr:LptF/LptG family permease [Blattabacterium punctulatus]AWU44848.1 YjgP/YjgQ family permease [Blattabacterium punctulatus]
MLKLKKLDLYMIRLFIVPFLVIFFSVIFVFIVQFFWSKIDELTGKDINIFIILKFIFYFGITIVPLVTPISILLTSIMTYGEISENQELISIKSSGISLFRIMKPILGLTLLLSLGLYFLSDYAIPKAKKKAKELGYQISVAHPSLKLKEGIFVNIFPDFFIKIDKQSGKDKNHMNGIFIFFYEKNLFINTILAKEGILIPNREDGYFRIKLINGFFYSDHHDEKKRPSYQIVQFDTLIQYFKIPLIEDKIKNLEDYDSYQTFDTIKLIEKINFLKKEKNKFDYELNKKNYDFLFFKKKLEKISNNRSLILYKKMIDRLSFWIEKLKHQKKIIKKRKINLAKYQLELQKKFIFPVTCIIMFLTGAPIGALIRKGGIGFPTIMAITIFIIYHTLLTITQNQAEKADIYPWISAWIPNFTFFPISIWITYKTVMDDF